MYGEDVVHDVRQALLWSWVLEQALVKEVAVVLLLLYAARGFGTYGRIVQAIAPGRLELIVDPLS